MYKNIGIFIIHDTFKITGRGIVFFGKLTSGKVITNALIKFNYKNKIIKRRIQGFDIEMRVKKSESVNHGLIIECKNEQEIIDFQKWKPNEIISEIIKLNEKDANANGKIMVERDTKH